MFTGLVQDLGTVTAVDATDDGVRLAVSTSLAAELSEGDSVAVNGVCLTATSIADGAFSADVMHESLRRSSLARGRRRARRSTWSCRCGRPTGSAGTSCRGTWTASRTSARSRTTASRGS